MPSIVIGGENTNVGLRYLDEAARQRQLAQQDEEWELKKAQILQQERLRALNLGQQKNDDRWARYKWAIERQDKLNGTAQDRIDAINAVDRQQNQQSWMNNFNMRDQGLREESLREAALRANNKDEFDRIMNERRMKLEEGNAAANESRWAEDRNLRADTAKQNALIRREQIQANRDIARQNNQARVQARRETAQARSEVNRQNTVKLEIQQKERDLAAARSIEGPESASVIPVLEQELSGLYRQLYTDQARRDAINNPGAFSASSRVASKYVMPTEAQQSAPNAGQSMSGMLSKMFTGTNPYEQTAPVPASTRIDVLNNPGASVDELLQMAKTRQANEQREKAALDQGSKMAKGRTAKSYKDWVDAYASQNNLADVSKELLLQQHPVWSAVDRFDQALKTASPGERVAIFKDEFDSADRRVKEDLSDPVLASKRGVNSKDYKQAISDLYWKYQGEGGMAPKFGDEEKVLQKAGAVKTANNPLLREYNANLEMASQVLTPEELDAFKQRADLALQSGNMRGLNEFLKMRVNAMDDGSMSQSVKKWSYQKALDEASKRYDIGEYIKQRERV